MKNVELEVSEPQRIILESLKPLNLFLAGTGAGKTHSMGLLSADFAINHPKAIGMIAANTNSQLTKSTLKNIFECWFSLFGWANEVTYVVGKIPPKHFKRYGQPLKEYDNTICFNNGAMIFTSSLENYKVIDGTELGYALLDETKDTRKEALTDVIMWRMRQKAMYIKDGIIYNEPDEGRKGYNPMFIFTSPAKVEWINEMFDLTDKYEDISRHIFSDTDFFRYEDEDKCITISSTFHNKKNLPEGFIEQKLKQFTGNQNKIDMFIYGSPIAKTGGEFFNQFKVLKHVKEVKFDPNLNVHISLDFNVSPYITMTCWQIIREDNIYKVRCFAELCLSSPKNNTEDLCKEFINRFILPVESRQKKFPGLFFYGDASGKNRSTLGKEHNFDILSRVMKKYLNSGSDRVLKRNPSVVATRDFMNKIFADGLPIVMEIDRSCKNLIADFEFLKEDADGGKLKVKVKDSTTGSMYEKYGHLGDSAIYFMCAAFDTLFDKE